MKTYSLLFLMGIVLLYTHTSFAQESRSIDEKGLSGKKRPVKNKISVFISGGSGLATAKMKDSLFTGNGWNIEGGVYIPILSNLNYKTGAGNYFTAGIDAAVNYGQQKADGSIAAYTRSFSLQDGSLNPAFNGNTPHAGVFQGLVGPKVEWGLGKISVSPSFLVGYLSLSRQSYTLVGTFVNPKQTTESKSIPFTTANSYSALGLVIKPRIELGYHFCEQVSLFAAGGIAIGPSLQNSIIYWKPQGSPGANNTYSYDQFANGAAKSITFNSRWQVASIQMGLRYTWIKSTFDKGHGGRKQRAATGDQSDVANNQPNELATGNPIPGIVVKGGKPGQPAPIFKTDSTTDTSNNRLSMTPTTTRQTQGKTFGEKVAGGLQSGASALSQGSSTTAPGKSGAVNPDSVATSSNTTGRLSMTPTTTRQTQGKTFGEKVAGGLQAGGSALSQGGSTVASGKGGTVKSSGAVSSSYAAGRLSMTPTTTRQTQGKTFGEKVASGLQAGGSAVSQGESAVASGKGGTVKSGGAVSSSYAAGRLSMTPTTTRQTKGKHLEKK